MVAALTNQPALHGTARNGHAAAGGVGGGGEVVIGDYVVKIPSKQMKQSIGAR